MPRGPQIAPIELLAHLLEMSKRKKQGKNSNSFYSIKYNCHDLYSLANLLDLAEKEQLKDEIKSILKKISDSKSWMCISEPKSFLIKYEQLYDKSNESDREDLLNLYSSIFYGEPSLEVYSKMGELNYNCFGYGEYTHP